MSTPLSEVFYLQVISGECCRADVVQLVGGPSAGPPRSSGYFLFLFFEHWDAVGNGSFSGVLFCAMTKWDPMTALLRAGSSTAAPPLWVPCSCVRKIRHCTEGQRALLRVTRPERIHNWSRSDWICCRKLTSKAEDGLASLRYGTASMQLSGSRVCHPSPPLRALHSQTELFLKWRTAYLIALSIWNFVTITLSINHLDFCCWTCQFVWGCS